MNEPPRKAESRQSKMDGWREVNRQPEPLLSNVPFAASKKKKKNLVITARIIPTSARSPPQREEEKKSAD